METQVFKLTEDVAILKHELTTMKQLLELVHKKIVKLESGKK